MSKVCLSFSQALALSAAAVSPRELQTVTRHPHTRLSVASTGLTFFKAPSRDPRVQEGLGATPSSADSKTKSAGLPCLWALPGASLYPVASSLWALVAHENGTQEGPGGLVLKAKLHRSSCSMGLEKEPESLPCGCHQPAHQPRTGAPGPGWLLDC